MNESGGGSGAAIQAALDWVAASGGGRVELPAGVFAIAAPGLRINSSRISLVGKGSTVTTLVQREPSRSGFIAIGAAEPLHAIEVAELALRGDGTVLGDYDRREINNVAIGFGGDTSDVHVHDLAISGFGVGIAPHYSADGRPTMRRARFERCVLRGLAPTQLRMHAGIVVNADGAVIEDNTVVGFSYGINPSYYSRNTRVARNRVELGHGAGVGIYMSSASGSTCEHNRIDIELPGSLTGYRADGCIKVGGVLSPPSSNFVVNDNRCTNGSIKVANASDGVITRNTIHGAVASGIYLDPYVDDRHPRPSGARMRVEHNTITSARGSGIYFPVAEQVTIKHNRIEACGVAGIFLERATNASVEHNVIDNCALQAIYVDGATATTVSRNTMSRREACRTAGATCPPAVLVRRSDATVTVGANEVAGYERDVLLQPGRRAD